jgi:homoserine O-acetyltransferase
MSATLTVSRRDSSALETSVAYEVNGPTGAPAILALGGISATRHVARSAENRSSGWWDGIAGPGCPLDTSTRRILGVEFRDGGCGEDGRPVEIVSTFDQAESIVAVLDEIGVNRLDAVVGASYGGMVALALAQRWPERVGRLVVISAAHTSHPMATGLRAIQRGIVELGLQTGRADEGMALGRAIAMTTYRTAREFAGRFDMEADVSGGTVEFDVERYLMHAGARFAERMTPARFLALSLSADLHRAVPEEITVPTTVIAAQGDTLVPPALCRALSRRLPRLEGFHTLRTRFGHDAFLTEPTQVGRHLTSALGTQS